MLRKTGTLAKSTDLTAPTPDYALRAKLPAATEADADSNKVRAGQPSTTALRVATLRAVHQLLDVPTVFDDSLALAVLGPQKETEIRCAPHQFNDPFAKAVRVAMAVRSRFAEDELWHAAKNGVTQYVVLGAGLDTFAYRHARDRGRLRVFEADHPSTQRWKRSLLEQSGIGIPEFLTFVPVDFERQTLAGQLQEAGLRSDAPVFFPGSA